MNHSVKSDEELIALLERTMHKVSVSAPEMEFSTAAGNQRWMAAAAAAVIVVGVGATGIALNARHDGSSPLTPGAQATTPVDTAEPITSTTMSSTDGGSSAVTTTALHSTTGTVRPLDPRDEAWRAAVYQHMASFGTCATANVEVGPGTLFNAKTACNHFTDGQPVDGSIVFMLNELPFATLAESVADFTKNGTGNGAAGVPIGTDAVMFVEKSNGVTRRASIVTAKHAVVIYSELLDDKYLPTGDHDLAAVAQDLNKVAGPLIAKAAGANGDGHCILASYIVLEGDTPAGVAQKFNVSMEALKAANVTTPSFETFSVGMKIFIPAQAPFVCTAASPTGGPQDTFPANG